MRKNVLVTGSRGFIGKNLCSVLRRHDDFKLYEYDVENKPEDLDNALQQADFIIHLAGINRPENTADFESGNAGFTDEICNKLMKIQRTPKIVLSSSIQAERGNSYGVSKRRAEIRLQEFAEKTNASCVIYRLKNLFGKWCRPNYNSVTATFCYNIARNIPIQISDPDSIVELTYIDDVVGAFLSELIEMKPGFHFASPLKGYRITLGQLANKLRIYKEIRKALLLPDLNDDFERSLYGTYISYLEDTRLDYWLEKKSDQRGSLAEFIKSPAMGQIFVSRTNPGVTRGDHYHHTKTEKFLILQGTAIIRFRHIESDRVLEYMVRGEEYRVVDIPPGYAHSIENIGEDELVTLFWACEMFNSQRPDTYFEKV